MAISTRNLKALPDLASLKRLLQAMAMLDAILQPDWQYRYYSFNAHWPKGQMMGSMRNGQGDEFFALFNNHGAFLKGFVHESPMARIPSEHFYRDLPREFDECRREAAFFPEDVTFCLWRLIGQPAWSSTTSSNCSCFSAQAMVYSMPAQPPFLTPMRAPTTFVPFATMIALMRSAAASVSVITLGRGRGLLMR
jgi:hypothetical protein